MYLGGQIKRNFFGWALPNFERAKYIKIWSWAKTARMHVTIIINRNNDNNNKVVN